MERGPNVSPVTLRPRFQDRTKAAVKEQMQERTLQERARDLGLMESESGARLKEILMKRFYERVDALIHGDPEAAAYQQIIADLGYTEDLARMAVDKLYQMSIRK